MALNKSQLAQLLKTTFQSAKDNSWTSDQVADSLADAINTFVLTADVAGVQVVVVNNASVVIGSGSQTGKVKLQ
jgi:hypothetical protein